MGPESQALSALDCVTLGKPFPVSSYQGCHLVNKRVAGEQWLSSDILQGFQIL